LQQDSILELLNVDPRTRKGRRHDDAIHDDRQGQQGVGSRHDAA
jgi:hypothetical protein